jgi:hypothetical protein
MIVASRIERKEIAPLRHKSGSVSAGTNFFYSEGSTVEF